MMNKRKSDDSYPRYMAFNKGQEAFQLFYERLCRIEPDTIVENLFHLASIINTFNRHHCTGIGTENPYYDIRGVIIPVFMNLGLYTNQEMNFHRLIAVQLKYFDGNVMGERGIYFVFDHPAFKTSSSTVRTNTRFKKPVFSLSVTEFRDSYYRPNIYDLVQKDIKSLDLIFDTETENYRYEPYNDQITNTTSIIYGNHPPLFGDLFVSIKRMGTEMKGSVIYCVDRDKFHLTQGTYAESKNRWLVDTLYIAHNRYKQGLSITYSDAYSDTKFLDEDGRTSRLFSFIFGLSSMIYVFENFDGLTYRPMNLCTSVLPNDLKKFATYTKTNIIKFSGYSMPYKPREKQKYITLITEDDEMIQYISRYHLYNNHINCLDASITWIDRITHGTNDKKTYPKEDSFIDIHGWDMTGSRKNNVHKTALVQQEIRVSDTIKQISNLIDTVVMLNKKFI